MVDVVTTRGNGLHQPISRTIAPAAPPRHIYHTWFRVREVMLRATDRGIEVQNLFVVLGFVIGLTTSSNIVAVMEDIVMKYANMSILVEQLTCKNCEVTKSSFPK